jgi:hypothetical protein
MEREASSVAETTIDESATVRALDPAVHQT